MCVALPPSRAPSFLAGLPGGGAADPWAGHNSQRGLEIAILLMSSRCLEGHCGARKPSRDPSPHSFPARGPGSMAQWHSSRAGPGRRRAAAGTARGSGLAQGPGCGLCLCPAWSTVCYRTVVTLAATREDGPWRRSPPAQPGQQQCREAARAQKKPGFLPGPLHQLHGAGVSHPMLGDHSQPGHQWQRQSPVGSLRRQSRARRWGGGSSAMTMAGTLAVSISQTLPRSA